MISINYDINDQSRAFSYWRLLGTGAKPPLEIGINTNTGTIKSITVFVDADCFVKDNFKPDVVHNGNVIVDAAIFKNENDYVDAEGEYYITESHNKLTCIFGLHRRILESIGNNRVRFLIDNNNGLCGFDIHGLEENEVKHIESVK